ncbi:MAG: deoxyribonuclease IV [Chlorobiaceae bacterium]|nr:deoxyribonuclease IV [Chlorobiaceae bacterium]NTV59800.1 deoxyribonuclease IV [Chlorobiaceae bacterium]
MKRIGAHVSIAGGIENAPLNAAQIGAKAFAMFTKNQRQWKAPALSPASVEAFRRNCGDHGFNTRHILPHDSYLINLGSPETDKLQRSREAFVEEMIRVEQLGLSMLNFHPGSHLNGVTTDDCLRLIAESINIALDNSRGVTAVIENTAGQGTNLGFRFEQLAALIAMVEDKTRAGICLDTCHLHASGYDLGNTEAAVTVFKEFDRVAGMEYLRGMHLNDALHPAGSRLDRHAAIGKGTIGMDTFRYIVTSPDFEEIPLILETPDSDNWKEEIAMLYSLSEQ